MRIKTRVSDTALKIFYSGAGFAGMPGTTAPLGSRAGMVGPAPDLRTVRQVGITSHAGRGFTDACRMPDDPTVFIDYSRAC